MTPEIRPCRDREELQEYARVVSYVFASSEGMDDELAATQPDWTVCAFIERRLVSTLGVWPFTVRLNGSPVPMGGVTAVGTLPNYRRRGLLRMTMRRALETMRDRRQPYAILWASMAAIYQRFGYGLATTALTYRFDPRLAGLAAPQAMTRQVDLLSADEAYSLIKPVFIHWATPRNLVIHRSAELWRVSTLRPHPKGLPVHVAVSRTPEGKPNGYAVYTARSIDHEPGEGEQELVVNELIALEPQAYVTLWEFLRAHDLAQRIVFRAVAPDDLAPALLLEPRVLNARASDGVWMRVVDVVPALEARPYATAGALVLRVVEDQDCPWNVGTYHLETDGPNARARPTGGEPDITLRPAALASLLAGMWPASYLWRAGLLEARSPELLARADALFRTEYPPYCPNGF